MSGRFHQEIDILLFFKMEINLIKYLFTLQKFIMLWISFSLITVYSDLELQDGHYSFQRKLQMQKYME